MNEPTDAEIDTLILEHGVMGQAWPTQRQLHAFARAVLAKWGTPPAVAGEPVAWLSTDSIGERYLCFTKPNDSDPVRPLVFGDTTPQPTQAQAGAVPPEAEPIVLNCEAPGDLKPGTLERFAALVAAREREACAQVCRSEMARAIYNLDNDLGINRNFWNGCSKMAASCAASITARGNP